MKTLLIALSAFLALSSSISAQETEKPSKEEHQKVWYSCPMHPQEMSMNEEDCGKCGMKMVKSTRPKYGSKMKGSPSSAAESKYVCKIDSSTSTKPGKCPKCHKNRAKMNHKKDCENHK